MTSRDDAPRDAVIVGGGVIGLSIAYELARRGRHPTVVDRGPEPGVASVAAAGMLAPVSEAEVEERALVALGLDSLARFPDFVQGIEQLTGRSCGFRRDGTLWVALDRDEAAQLAHLERAIERRGLSALRLSAEEVLEREPHLSSRVVGGLLAKDDLQVDPRALCAALEDAVRALGGSIERGQEVDAIEAASGGRLRVSIAGEAPRAIGASVVVLAAGAWAGHGIRLPIEAPRLRPVRGQILRLKGNTSLRHVIRHPDCYLVPREDGDLLIGGTVEEVGYDARVTAGAVHDLLRDAWRLVPGIYDLELAEIAVGFRPALEDHLPMLGPTRVEGLFLAVGHYRGGVLLAPATAHYVAEAIVTGTTPPALAPFSTERAPSRHLFTKEAPP